MKEATREIRLAASLDHPCTLRLLGWIRAPLQTITELCCGDLTAFYQDKIGVLQYDERQALRLLKVGLCEARVAWDGGFASTYSQLYTTPPTQESALGLLYLHSVEIIHRDVKPANILVGKTAHVAKIADYGISRVADIGGDMTIKGTLIYQAPELSRGERYGFAADVYSFAITMYELCDRVGLSPSEAVHSFQPSSLRSPPTLPPSTGSPVYKVGARIANQARHGRRYRGSATSNPQDVESRAVDAHHLVLE